MGVQGLWELLAPVGRRVSVEALSGRKLAIDASIWIIQFMKAMRDDKGDMIRNAHLLGFFRRICKLLYLRAKPVFVFDGGTPALKRRTVIARRRQRERAQSKIRKTAEKLLLNHLRTRRLEEIAQNIGLAAQAGKKATSPKGKEEEQNNGFVEVQDCHVDTNLQEPPAMSVKPSTTYDNGKSMARFYSIGEERSEELDASDAGTINASDESNDENEEIFMPPMQGHVDPGVLASLPPSMQLNLLVQMREQLVTDNRKKFQKVAKNPASFSQMQIQAYLKTVAFRRDINEVQKAAAGKGIGGIPSARIASEVDREYIFSSSFQSEKQADINKEATHNTSSIEQDGFGSNSSHGSLGPQVDMSEGPAISEGGSLQELNQDNVLVEDDSIEDNDIEWEDGNDVMGSAANQPISGAVITIEIDQNDIFSEGVEVEKLSLDSGFKGEDIEWEDGVFASNCNRDIQPVDAAVVDGGDDTIEWEDEEEFLASKGMSADSAEIVGKTLMEIEAAELEEAIRQSLEDHGTSKASKLIIRDELVSVSKQDNIMLGPDTATMDVPLSEEAFLSRERERKGKAIVGGVFYRDSMHKESLKPLEVAPSKLHPSPASEVAFQAHAPLQTTKYLEQECENVVKVEASLPVVESREVLHESKHITKQSTAYSKAVEGKKIGLEEKLQEKASVGDKEASVVNTEGQAASTCKVLEHEKLEDSCLPHVGTNVSSKPTENDYLEEALLKEAEELDLYKEQEAFLKREEALLAEREELAHQQAELQAEMEAEEAAIRANIQDERDLLLQEEMELLATQRKNERNAESVTGEMFSECQELLQMFGLPYIIAPMEAEAQCAYMDSIGLVDGVVTDDCDVFLFGGRNVYKNIFDDRKYVETYYTKDIESELGLNQEKLIHMALLLGSDYTEGISGIGIVNAIEVVNAFQGEAGLQKFKEWLDAPDLTLLDKFHGGGQKQQTKKKKNEREHGAEENSINGAEEPDDTANEGSENAKYNYRQQDFMDKHRAVSKNWNVPESFPNPVVINAYLSAQVDKSTEAFTWGRPDLEALRRSCLDRFGWNKSKSDELLLPVLKEHDRHETQLRLEAFYTFNQRFAKIRSKRIQKAVTHVTGRISSELVDFPREDVLESPQKCKIGKRKNAAPKKAVNESDLPKNASSKRISRRTKDASQIGEGVQEVSTVGRGRGRGRSTSTRGRVNVLKKSDTRLSSEALTDETSSEELLDLDDKGSMGGTHVAAPRRSNRLPERAVYKFSGSEEDSDTGADQEKGCSPGHARSRPPEVIEEPVQVNELFEVKSNKDGEDIGEASHVNQSEVRKNYLVMGGGFCDLDGESAQPFWGSIEVENEEDGGTKLNSLAATCPVENSVSSTGGEALFPVSEKVLPSRGEGPTQAPPFAQKEDIGEVSYVNQSQVRKNHLVMGGGFCDLDDESAQPFRGPIEVENEEDGGTKLNSSAAACPVENSVPSTGGGALFPVSETVLPSGGEGPTQAPPFSQKKDIGEASDVNQSQVRKDYLVMGGGFCDLDDESAKPFRGPIEVENEEDGGTKLMNSSAATCPVENSVPSTAGGPLFPVSETVLPSGGGGPTLYAVPFLRRKKRRVS